MIFGKSSYHVNQDEGKIYSKTEIKGYYNNLTEKVSRFGLEGDLIPTTIVDSGKEVYFSIAIFQYGLGAYDLFLLNQNEKEYAEDMTKKVLACAYWAVKNQNIDGSWNTFDFENEKNPFSSMAQGEGISLLLRAYLINGDDVFLDSASRAYNFMLLPVENGGVAEYHNNGILFYECQQEPLILNGWIFSIWGIWDYYCFFKDDKVKKVYDLTIMTLESKLRDFDIKYWSKYEDGKRIASPFYHSLHIAQLRVLGDMTGNRVFSEYADKWFSYKKRWFNRMRAFLKKAWQKIFE